MKTISKLVVLTTTLLCLSCTKKTENPYKEKLEIGIETLISCRDTSGIWMPKEIGWWNSANILTAILSYTEATGTIEEYKPLIADIYAKSKTIGEAGNFINDYYDDEGWWLLAWVEAYNQTKNKEYLSTAEYIFDDMAKCWDDTCGGGIYWRKPNKYKNAIANNLFNLAAARLYTATRDKKYEQWFLKNSKWFLESGMIKEDGLIYDGTRECTPRGKHFTYNSGVAIAWLTELYLLTGDENTLKKAEHIADAALNYFVTAKGVLKEIREPEDLGNDGIQFKGIFIRHLSFLYEVSKDEKYKQFILKNADSIIKNNYNAETKYFGSFWSGPFDKSDSKGHSSAWEAIIAAYNISEQ